MQRVSAARVTVAGQVVGRIDEPGLCVFVGVTHDDTPQRAAALAAKLHTLRVLAEDGCVAETDAPMLVVSQFTLYADTRRGRRPSWHRAAPAEQAEPLVRTVVEELRNRGARVETGRFGAQMAVELVNDGPVTLVLDI